MTDPAGKRRRPGRSSREAEAPALDVRLLRVLRCVLDQYIETAQPVASRSVARRVRVSPATVRTAMGELADAGFLRQPHTSAGRVPTAQAFRLYVDELMREAPWPPRAQARAGLTLSGRARDTDDLLRQAADWLSESTGQLGFFLAGQPDRIILRRLQFVRLSAERVMALLISQRGVVQTCIVEESGSDGRELERVSERLSEFVAGFTLAQARARLARAIERERDALARKALALGVAGLSSAGGELYVSDKSYLLQQPEFADVVRLRDILAALAEKERMMRLLDQILRADVLQVVIGEELEDPGMEGCAVVTAPFGDAPALGGIGVIGPVRMPYHRVIPVVRGLSKMIGGYLG